MEDIFMETNETSVASLSLADKITAFMRKWAWLGASIVGLLAICFLFGDLFKYKDALKAVHYVHLWDYFNGTYKLDWTIIATLALLVFGIALSPFKKFGEGFPIASALSYLLAVCFLILSREFFVESNNLDVTMQYGIALSAAFAAFGAILSIVASYEKVPVTIEDMAEEAMLVALAFGLNFLKIPVGATGGSINLQMLPLMVIALRRGPARGFVAGGLVFGLLTCFTDGYGFVTYPFDYLIGFGSVAVMGFFGKAVLKPGQKNYSLKGEILILVAGILTTLVRFTGSTASSMIVYSYTFVEAVAYNALYIPVSGAVATIALMALYGPLCRVNSAFPVQSPRVLLAK
jgi:thiamine transporter